MTMGSFTLLAPQAFSAAIDELARLHAELTGVTAVIVYGPAGGTAAHSIAARLERAEPADLVILPLAHLRALADRQRILPDSIVPVMRSGIGVAVQRGMPLPAIGTADELREALLGADSIAYSAAGSGDYVSGELFERLGITSNVLGKTRRVAEEPVAAVVARGEAALGFQQLIELLAVPGVNLVGPLPASLQRYTDLGAALPSHGQQAEYARGFIAHLRSDEAGSVLIRHGLEAWND